MADLRCCRGGYVDGTPYGPEHNQIDVLRYFFSVIQRRTPHIPREGIEKMAGARKSRGQGDFKYTPV